MRRRFMSTLAAVLLSGGGHAQEAAISIEAPAGAASGPQRARFELGSSAAVDTAAAIWAVAVDSGRLMIRRSQGPGLGWSEPVPLTPPGEAVEADRDSRPMVAAGTAGEIYVTWTRTLGKPDTGEIRFSRSLDHGRTFSAPVTVHRDREVIAHRFNAIAVSRLGQVFVAWIDRRDAARARAEGRPQYPGAALYYAVSDDRGASFRGDFKVADHACECCRVALLPQEGGSIYALWRYVFDTNVRDHALAYLRPDGKASPPQRATFDDWRVDACPDEGPALAADASGTLHAVWFAQSSAGAGAFYGRLLDGRVDGQRRIGGGRAEHPDIEAYGDRVVVAWKEFDGNATNLRLMQSGDRGLTWTERDIANTADASGQPQLLRVTTGFQVFWNTRAEGLSLFPVPW